MKLRKALDKAKENRNGEIQESAPDLTDTNSTVSGSETPGRQQMNATWKAPVYSDSIEYRIDPSVVERNRGVSINKNSREIERYKILRTRIHQESKSKKLNTIMVTSANRREGKTITTINMGLTFAKDLKQTVLMVDCDFTGQDIHKYLGIESRYSLIDYFLDDIALNQMIIWPGIEKLTLISGNRTVQESSELLSSEMMESLVSEMGERYDDRYVFFDSPPILDHSEAIAMAPMMDGIIMVVESGITPKKDIAKALSMIPEEKFLGFVLNKQE